MVPSANLNPATNNILWVAWQALKPFNLSRATCSTAGCLFIFKIASYLKKFNESISEDELRKCASTELVETARKGSHGRKVNLSEISRWNQATMRL